MKNQKSCDSCDFHDIYSELYVYMGCISTFGVLVLARGALWDLRYFSSANHLRIVKSFHEITDEALMAKIWFFRIMWFLVIFMCCTAFVCIYGVFVSKNWSWRFRMICSQYTVVKTEYVDGIFGHSREIWELSRGRGAQPKIFWFSKMLAQKRSETLQTILRWKSSFYPRFKNDT